MLLSGHSKSKHQCCCTSTMTHRWKEKKAQWPWQIDSVNQLTHPTPAPRWDSSPLQAEDNQPSPHLLPGLSPGQKIVASLQKERLLACFHKYIAMVVHSTHSFFFNSIIFFPRLLLSSGSVESVGVYPGCHWMKAGRYHGCVASSTQGTFFCHVYFPAVLTLKWGDSRIINYDTHFKNLNWFLLIFLSLSCHQSESEEVRQILWLSVVLYKSPESELTCCLLLSTDAIYFLLEDSASTLGHQSGVGSHELFTLQILNKLNM